MQDAFMVCYPAGWVNVGLQLWDDRGLVGNSITFNVSNYWDDGKTPAAFNTR